VLPLLISFQWNDPLSAALDIRCGDGHHLGLMVSRLPTPSIKYMKLQRQHRFWRGLFCALAALSDCLALGHHDHRSVDYWRHRSRFTYAH
jgi:hypothetical protein